MSDVKFAEVVNAARQVSQQCGSVVQSMRAYASRWIAACGNPRLHKFVVVRVSPNPEEYAAALLELRSAKQAVEAAGDKASKAQVEALAVARAKRSQIVNSVNPQVAVLSDQQIEASKVGESERYPTSAWKRSMSIMTNPAAAAADKVEFIGPDKWTGNKGEFWAVFLWQKEVEVELMPPATNEEGHKGVRSGPKQKVHVAVPVFQFCLPLPRLDGEVITAKSEKVDKAKSILESE